MPLGPRDRRTLVGDATGRTWGLPGRRFARSRLRCSPRKPRSLSLPGFQVPQGSASGRPAGPGLRVRARARGVLGGGQVAAAPVAGAGGRPHRGPRAGDLPGAAGAIPRLSGGRGGPTPPVVPAPLVVGVPAGQATLIAASPRRGVAAMDGAFGSRKHRSSYTHGFPSGYATAASPISPSHAAPPEAPSAALGGRPAEDAHNTDRARHRGHRVPPHLETPQALLTAGLVAVPLRVLSGRALLSFIARPVTALRGSPCVIQGQKRRPSDATRTLRRWSAKLVAGWARSSRQLRDERCEWTPASGFPVLSPGFAPALVAVSRAPRSRTTQMMAPPMEA